jgi:hypothetical protein
MIKQNIVYLAGKSFAVDIIGDALYFPIWWYTLGLRHIIFNAFKSIRDTAHNLALRLLVLNIFKPMFAQYDRAGRIISFFMRVVILIARTIYIVIFAILRLIIVVIWIMFPLLVVYRLIDIFILSYVGGAT